MFEDVVFKISLLGVPKIYRGLRVGCRGWFTAPTADLSAFSVHLFFLDTRQPREERTQEAVAQMRPEFLDIASFYCSWCLMSSGPAFAYEEFGKAAQRNPGLRIVTTKRMAIFVRCLPPLRRYTGQAGQSADTPEHSRNGRNPNSRSA